MKLYELTVGQRFCFTDKHRGKVFEVIEKNNVRTPKGRETYIIYHDVIHKNQVIYNKESKTFRMPVQLVTENRVIELTPHEVDTLKVVLHSHYLNEIDEAMKSKINALHIKLTGSAGRRVVLPEGE